jgi:hypothetical protein
MKREAKSSWGDGRKLQQDPWNAIFTVREVLARLVGGASDAKGEKGWNTIVVFGWHGLDWHLPPAHTCPPICQHQTSHSGMVWWGILVKQS